MPDQLNLPDRAFVIGSFCARSSLCWPRVCALPVKGGGKLPILHASSDDDQLITIANKMIVAPMIGWRFCRKSSSLLPAKEIAAPNGFEAVIA
jgi:NADH-quinone oxidoreductase subunit G